MTTQTQPDAKTPAERFGELLADGVFSVVDAAAFMGITRSEVYAMLDRGELASTKLGRRRLIPKRAAVAALARQLVAG